MSGRFDEDKANAAAKDAKLELEFDLGTLSSEQRKGVDLVFRWIRRHYARAGYKRLCRIMLDVLPPYRPGQ